MPVKAPAPQYPPALSSSAVGNLPSQDASNYLYQQYLNQYAGQEAGQDYAQHAFGVLGGIGNPNLGNQAQALGLLGLTQGVTGQAARSSGISPMEASAAPGALGLGPLQQGQTGFAGAYGGMPGSYADAAQAQGLLGQIQAGQNYLTQQQALQAQQGQASQAQEQQILSTAMGLIHQGVDPAQISSYVTAAAQLAGVDPSVINQFLSSSGIGAGGPAALSQTDQQGITNYVFQAYQGGAHTPQEIQDQVVQWLMQGGPGGGGADPYKYVTNKTAVDSLIQSAYNQYLSAGVFGQPAAPAGAVPGQAGRPVLNQQPGQPFFNPR